MVYIIYSLIFLLILSLTWIGPRYLGLIGMIVSHILIVIVWGTSSILLSDFAKVEHYDGLTGIVLALELLVQSFLINLLLCPIAFKAMFRWWNLSPMSPHFRANE